MASVGLMPVLLKCVPLLFEQIRRDRSDEQLPLAASRVPSKTVPDLLQPGKERMTLG